MVKFRRNIWEGRQKKCFSEAIQQIWSYLLSSNTEVFLCPLGPYRMSSSPENYTEVLLRKVELTMNEIMSMLWRKWKEVLILTDPSSKDIPKSEASNSEQKRKIWNI